MQKMRIVCDPMQSNNPSRPVPYSSSPLINDTLPFSLRPRISPSRREKQQPPNFPHIKRRSINITKDAKKGGGFYRVKVNESEGFIYQRRSMPWAKFRAEPERSVQSSWRRTIPRHGGAAARRRMRRSRLATLDTPLSTSPDYWPKTRVRARFWITRALSSRVIW